ncbi:MAG: hypothetical protein U0746_18650 [Gemmataceae bacterium]
MRDAPGPDPATLAAVLWQVQTLARFQPNQSMPEYRWWVDEVAKTTP